MWQDKLPEPVEWYHQLSGPRRADATRFRPGDKLTAELKDATGRAVLGEPTALEPEGSAELLVAGPRLQLLSFPGCPNAEILSANLAQACAEVGLPASLIEHVNLVDLGDDDPRRVWGSPTILVDGADLMGLPRPAAPALSCRIYPGSTLPTAQQIASLLRKY